MSRKRDQLRPDQLGTLPPWRPLHFQQQTKGQLPNLRYCFVRITPSPMLLRCFSEYFPRAFSACCFVLKGFDSSVNSPSTYLNRSHCFDYFEHSKLITPAWSVF
jgi:hypothetical protein